MERIQDSCIGFIKGFNAVFYNITSNWPLSKCWLMDWNVRGNMMIYGIILRFMTEMYSGASQRDFFCRISIRIVLSNWYSKLRVWLVSTENEFFPLSPLSPSSQCQNRVWVLLSRSPCKCLCLRILGPLLKVCNHGSEFWGKC